MNEKTWQLFFINYSEEKHRIHPTDDCVRGDFPCPCMADTCGTASSARTTVPTEVMPNGAQWRAKASCSICHNTPAARSLAGTVAPAEEAPLARRGTMGKACRSVSAFREDPMRQCVHMRAYLGRCYSTGRDARMCATARTRRDGDLENSEVIFPKFSPL